MSNLEYVELSCHVEPVDPWREILIAELADIGFDSFEDLPNGFKAYAFAGAFNIEAISQVFTKYKESGKVRIAFEHKVIKSSNWNKVWESNFDPVVLASKCYVRAPFHPPSENFEMEIIIEPKMSFGTG
ncbi:MAG TPA: 50S ribosomal protein L11 methyltransferase, partial [Bacteroidales bacterium]|nr:50S ribosomal protein L11 methyltransferase [Bacteroidales bacterium]